MSTQLSPTFTVFFGGTYTEFWNSDSKLIICYSNRQSCKARLIHGNWSFNLPIPSLNTMADEYATCSCDIQLAIFLCKKNNQDLAKLYAYINSCSVIAPFELFRTLLDDELLSIEQATAIVLRCFPTVCFNIDLNLLAELQPRTSALVPIFRDFINQHPIVQHISNNEYYRTPSGAVPTNTSIQIRVACYSESVLGIDFIVCDHNNDPVQLPMDKEDLGYCISWNTGSKPMAYWYYFRIRIESGFLWLIPDESGYYGIIKENISSEFRLTVFKNGFRTPDWLKKAICYQIFPDRFHRENMDTVRNGISYHGSIGQKIELHKNFEEAVKYKPSEGEKDYVPNDFYGGTLEGIISQIPYLKSLGVTVLYLNPIFEAASNHRYDTANYENIDPILGNVFDFRLLCSKMEAQGIHVILDGVFSHTGADSIYFNRYGHYATVGAFQSQDSQYYKWYKFIDFPNTYKSWWGFEDLPEIDKYNTSWQKYIIHDENCILRLWIQRGASGWRLDVADEIPDEILSEFRKSVKAENSDAVLIGEVWEDATTKISYGKQRKYALGTSLDSVMNYPLRAEVLQYLHFEINAEQLAWFLQSQRDNYPPEMYCCLMNLMGSHDVERLRTNLGVKEDTNQWPVDKRANFTLSPSELQTATSLEKLAASIQFSIPGMPSIYYGDEIGMEGCRDPFNRGYFRAGENPPLEYYRKLSLLRLRYPSLRDGSASFGFYGNDVLIIHRFANNEYTHVFINRSQEKCYYPLRKDYKDLLTGTQVSDTLVIPAVTSVFLYEKKAQATN